MDETFTTSTRKKHSVGHDTRDGLDHLAYFNQVSPAMSEQREFENQASPASDFGALVFEETIRRTLRQTPEQRLNQLRAALRDADQRGMIPMRDRQAHEKQLLWLIQRESSKA